MAGEFTFSFLVQNDRQFDRALERLAATTDDFRIPFNLIANDWIQGNRKLFTLSGPGLYQDLAPTNSTTPSTFGARIPTTSNYKAQKQKKRGFVYPILVSTGRLAASLLNKNASEGVVIVTKKSLTLGTTVPYAIYHQSDRARKRIPQRKMIFIDGGPAEVAKDASVAGRLERWQNIINSHILQILTGKVS